MYEGKTTAYPDDGPQLDRPCETLKYSDAIQEKLVYLRDLVDNLNIKIENVAGGNEEVGNAVDAKQPHAFNFSVDVIYKLDDLIRTTENSLETLGRLV